MASRLSPQALQEAYDVGHQAMPWVSQAKKHLDLLDIPDIQKLVRDPRAKSLVQAVPPQKMYFAIKQNGVEDSLAVLPLLSQEQVTAIVDYDAWSRERLLPKRVLQWLMAFRNHGPEEMVWRLRGLGEETQVATLAPLIRVFDQDEYEKLSSEEQDQLYSLPRNAVYYAIESTDKEVHGMVEALVEGCLAVDVGYAMSLLAHAAYMPPNESEALGLQFRNARMEEDGFVSFEESLAIFDTAEGSELRRKWSSLRKAEGGSQSSVALIDEAGREALFLDRILAGSLMEADAVAQLKASLVYVANSVMTACRVDAEDVAETKQVLEQVHGLVSLGLEILAGGRFDYGVQILGSEAPRLIFASGLSVIEEMRQSVAHYLNRVGVPGAKELARYSQERRYGAALTILDQKTLPVFGLQRNEMLKGLYNRFPMVAWRSTGEDENRIMFYPLARLEQLAVLFMDVNAFAGLLRLAKEALGERPLVDLDRALMTAAARWFVSEQFDAAPLERDEVAQFIELSDDTLKERRAGLIRYLQAMVSERPWNIEGHGQQVSESYVAQSLEESLDSLFVVKSERPESLGEFVDLSR